MASIIFGILIFSIIIFVHELGHFVVAKACGVGIYEFAMGMGPKIVSRKGKDGVLYSLRLFPIGGFVSMVGEDEEVDDDERSLSKKPIWQRFLVISAGAFTNLLLGMIVMSIIVIFSQQLYSNKIESFLVLNNNDEIVQTYQGFEVGDEIVRIGKTKINVRSDLVYTVMRQGDKKVDVTVRRDNKNLILQDVQFPTMTEKGVAFGNASFFIPEVKDKNIGSIVEESFCQSIATIKMIWHSFYDLITGKYGTEVISGPVGVVSEIGKTAQYGISALAYLFVVISMNVGIFNLFPLPALDGGRLMFLFIELIRGKPVKAKYEGYIHFAGLVLLLLFMALITFQDIAGLIGK